jgi:hypothetical protein
MSRYNEELAKAGVLLAGEGLQPSSKGARVRFSGDRRIVIDGPFTETKELIAGFWLWQVKSAEDFGAEFTPELREQEERVRAQAAQRAQKR